jgi:hypothetical protein
MARRLPVVMSHAPGLRGMPSLSHCASRNEGILGDFLGAARVASEPR